MARYDGVADWYDETMATSEVGLSTRRVALRLLGPGPGRLLDIGCGTGAHTRAFTEAGWSTVGVDISTDQLRLARARGCEVVEADAVALPFPGESFDAVVSVWTHTDLDDWAAVLVEVARVLRRGGAFVYLGAHPCFVGPHSRFIRAEGVPELYPGYAEARRYDEAPGVSPEGLRARVGGVHLPLGLFLDAVLSAGLRLAHVEEPADEGREYPYRLAFVARRAD